VKGGGEERVTFLNQTWAYRTCNYPECLCKTPSQTTPGVIKFKTTTSKQAKHRGTLLLELTQFGGFSFDRTGKRKLRIWQTRLRSPTEHSVTPATESRWFSMPNARQARRIVCRTADSRTGSGATMLFELTETKAIRSNLRSSWPVTSRFPCSKGWGIPAVSFHQCHAVLCYGI
jgi:hypothetical protein